MTLHLPVPHTTPGQWPGAIAPARFAAHVHHALPVGCRVALLGLPDDTGVALNNGRVGAADGPRAFRAALAAYGVAEPAGWQWPVVLDAGDVQPARGGDADALVETHRRVTEATDAIVRAGLFPIAIGGGHDLTYAFVRAVAAHARGPMHGEYFDAHLDVRETAGSGMPFRKLVEECGVQSLRVHGLSDLVNSAAHRAWFAAHGGVVARGSEEPTDGGAGVMPDRDTFVSFDMDVLDASIAPGVSALNPAGWSGARGAAWVRWLGARKNVRCFDIMELNPRYDADGRTARAAAHIFLSFLRGFAERGADLGGGEL